MREVALLRWQEHTERLIWGCPVLVRGVALESCLVHLRRVRVAGRPVAFAEARLDSLAPAGNAIVPGDFLPRAWRCAFFASSVLVRPGESIELDFLNRALVAQRFAIEPLLDVDTMIAAATRNP